MTMSCDRQSLKTFLADTVTILCKNFLRFECEFTVEGLIGITLDQKDVFLISIKETVKSSVDRTGLSENEDLETTVASTCDDFAPQSDLTEVQKAVDVDSIGQPTIPLACDVERDCSLKLPCVESVKKEGSDGSSIVAELQHDKKKSENFASSAVAEHLKSGIALSPRTSAGTGSAGNSTTTSEPGCTYSTNITEISETEFKETSRNYGTSGTELRETAKNYEIFDIELKETSKNFSIADTEFGDKSKNYGILDAETFKNYETGSCSTELQFLHDSSSDVIEIKEESLPEDEPLLEQPFDSVPQFPVLNSLEQCSRDFAVQEMELESSAPLSWEMNPASSVASGYQPAIYATSSAQHLGNSQSSSSRTQKRKFYECQKCGSKLTTLYSLKKHEAIIHQGNYQFKCHLCGKGLRTEYNLRGHMASRHNMKKDFCCSVCAREFGYRHTLRDHMIACHGMSI